MLRSFPAPDLALGLDGVCTCGPGVGGSTSCRLQRSQTKNKEPRQQKYIALFFILTDPATKVAINHKKAPYGQQDAEPRAHATPLPAPHEERTGVPATYPTTKPHKRFPLMCAQLSTANPGYQAEGNNVNYPARVEISTWFADRRPVRGGRRTIIAPISPTIPAKNPRTALADESVRLASRSAHCAYEIEHQKARRSIDLFHLRAEIVQNPAVHQMQPAAVQESRSDETPVFVPSGRYSDPISAPSTPIALVSPIVR